MQLIWRESALRDVEQAIAYIAERHPAAAASQFAQIISHVQQLTMFPRSGRIGRMDNTRELVVARTPFVIVYILTENVELLRVLHGARQWPPR